MLLIILYTILAIQLTLFITGVILTSKVNNARYNKIGFTLGYISVGIGAVNSIAFLTLLSTMI